MLKQSLPAALAHGEMVAELYGVDPEDMSEAAAIGAWTAWETYDPEAGTMWTTWFRRNVNWALLEGLRDWGKRRYKEVAEFNAAFQTVSFAEPVGGRGDHGAESMGLLLEDVVADPAAAFEHRVLERAEAEDYLSQMLPRERAAFRGRYMHDQLKKDVAKTLKISPSRVSQLEDQARQRLRATYDVAAAWVAVEQIIAERLEALPFVVPELPLNGNGKHAAAIIVAVVVDVTEEAGI